MKKIFYDKIRLGSGHSLIVGHTPDKLTLEKVCKNKPQDIVMEQFGLFESAAPNFNTYYPEVSAADLVPKDGDFILPIFRALSEVIVHKKFNPIDFGQNGVLRNSMNKLKGQTIYPNHEPIVGNEIGSVSAVEWQEGYTSNGVKVPAGINAQMKVDAKSNPKIARNILMDPPAIHSTSVTVSFGWEPSHTFTDINEFWNMLGKPGKDGQLVRRIVTEIKGFHEISFVSHGADPFAQKVNEKGKIVNPEYANSQYSLAAKDEAKPSVFYFDFKDKVSLSDESRPEELTNINNEEPMKKEFIEKLAKQYKVSEDQITEEFIQEKLTAGETAATELATAKTNHTTALGAKDTEITNLKTERDGLKTAKETAEAELAKIKPSHEAQITHLRSEVKRVYGVIKGEKAEATMLASFDTATEEQLKAFIKDYNTELEQKFPATCKSCGSTEVARNTATVVDPNGGKKPDGKTSASKTDQEVANEFRKESKPGFIFDGKAEGK